ncbi:MULTISPECIES: hydrogenase maturation protease [Microbacterium]|uniref:hydrogenase maturation protease n=1 Tax=Microbacterium TaxID=33882 RepID=UPI001BB20CA8|nr:hydrogenase maturation protease [Microbacterium sp. 4NA327F11]
MTGAGSAPYELLDEVVGPRLDLLVIGCGNVLRGDDAAGPVVVRRLWEAGALPESVRLADGGTSGMDVAFQMQRADRVLIVDAASTGAEPGTLYAVPGDVVAGLPAAGTLGSHDFRWDHAIAFARWLLGPYFPAEVDVVLIEGASFGYGDALSPAVERGVERAVALVTERIAEYA